MKGREYDVEKLYVVGRTDEREVYVASLDRAFILNEYLLIQEKEHEIAIGEIIETYAYPSIAENTFPDELGIQQSIESLFTPEDLKDKTLYIGKLKLLAEYQTPITPHATLRVPEFHEIEKQLIPVSPNEGFTLGVIKGTESLYEKLPESLKDIAPLYHSKDRTIQKQNEVPFIFDFKTFKEYPHMGFFGGSGSGKTFGLRVLLEEMMKYRLPAIVFDPHYEMDFSTTMSGLDDKYQVHLTNQYEIFEIGKNVGINFTELSSDEIITLLEFIAEVSQPMKGAIEALHQQHDSFTTLISRVNKLKKAFENMEKPEREREDLKEDEALLYVKYKDMVAGATTLQAVSWRLDQLEKTGLFNYDIHEVESALLRRKMAVIRGKQRHLQMIASYLIGKLYYKRRYYKDWLQMYGYAYHDKNRPGKFPPFFVVMDEAHIFAPEGKYINPTKRILKEIAQEARKYGVIEIFGTQRPALLDKTITAQLNTKVIFRTGIKDDMEMIAKETNLNQEQIKRLPDLSSGNAFVSSATLSKTMYIQFRSTKTQSPHGKNPFDELEEFNQDEKLKEVLKGLLPLTDSSIPKVHSEINQKMRKSLSIKEIQEVLEEMVLCGEIQKEQSVFGSRYRLISNE